MPRFNFDFAAVYFSEASSLIANIIFVRENKSFSLELYKKMIVSRNLEIALQRPGIRENLQRPIYLSTGQEACGVGVALAVPCTDYILLSSLGYRSMAYAVGRELDLASYIKTIFFTEGEYQDLFMNGFIPDSGSIGANFSTAVGRAWAIQYSKERRVVVCVFGDGTVSRGTFHSALNVSKLWNLPILWICEANQYSISTPLSKLLSQTDIFKLAQGYGIPGCRVDGNNVISVWRTTTSLIGKIKKDGGPAFLEMRTYRQGGHTHNDKDDYRLTAEKEIMKRRDPIALMKKVLYLANNFKDEELINIEKSAEGFVNKIVSDI